MEKFIIVYYGTTGDKLGESPTFEEYPNEEETIKHNIFDAAYAEVVFRYFF
jgi:hypothetical protein